MQIKEFLSVVKCPEYNHNTERCMGGECAGEYATQTCCLKCELFSICCDCSGYILYVAPSGIMK